jgi:hypothetical protein
MIPDSPFPSFWLAGFESACHINRLGLRLDLIAATDHDRVAREDYARVRALGMRGVRDGIRWPLIDRGGGYDFSSFVPMVRAAQAEVVTVNWNLCHYGWPDGVDVFSAAFVDRFARYVGQVARVLREEGESRPVLTVVNEVSFLAWAAGDTGGFIYPHASGRGHELKRQLVRAVIAGIEAVRAISPGARFLHVDPLINVIPRRDRPDDQQAADAYTDAQYEAWDLIAGRREPALGGREDYLDVMGFNFYHSNQWELDDGRLRWEDDPRDARWVPLNELLARAWRRYQRPIILAETSHFGVGRGRWILEIASEIAAGLRRGLPIQGVCVYPVIDRPDWEDPQHWHNSGLWDVRRDQDGLARVLNEPYADAFREAQSIVASPAGERFPSAQV